MSLTLHMHPLSSFCQKVLIALYENATPFERIIVDLGNEAARREFLKIAPLGKFPVLVDESKGLIIPESSIIIEYLARNYPGKTQLLPVDPERRFEVRQLDRFFDWNVNLPMQKIVTDKIPPIGKQDTFGVEQAKQQVQTAYEIIDRDMAAKPWAAGEEFTMADCAAAPALFYANQVLSLGQAYKKAAAYLQRLMDRPSYARAHREAQPYFSMFPGRLE